LDNEKDVDPFDFIRMIAVARLLMPRSHVRLSAGRQAMTDEMQALCFLAGANSIFYGEKLLTTGNPDVERDRSLFERLGIKPEQREAGHVHGAHDEHGAGATALEHAEQGHGCGGAGSCGHAGGHASAGG
jgi:biotin synthase